MRIVKVDTEPYNRLTSCTAVQVHEPEGGAAAAGRGQRPSRPGAGRPRQQVPALPAMRTGTSAQQLLTTQHQKSTLPHTKSIRKSGMHFWMDGWMHFWMDGWITGPTHRVHNAQVHVGLQA